MIFFGGYTCGNKKLTSQWTRARTLQQLLYIEEIQKPMKCYDKNLMAITLLEKARHCTIQKVQVCLSALDETKYYSDKTEF